jgi:hypothetical protein
VGGNGLPRGDPEAIISDYSDADAEFLTSNRRFLDCSREEARMCSMCAHFTTPAATFGSLFFFPLSASIGLDVCGVAPGAVRKTVLNVSSMIACYLNAVSGRELQVS